MNRILATLVLTSVFAVSAFAGEIPTCGCKALTADVPTVGTAPAPVIGEVRTNDTTESGQIETNLLTTVLLTFLSW